MNTCLQFKVQTQLKTKANDFQIYTQSSESKINNLIKIADKSQN